MNENKIIKTGTMDIDLTKEHIKKIYAVVNYLLDPRAVRYMMIMVIQNVINIVNKAIKP